MFKELRLINVLLKEEKERIRGFEVVSDAHRVHKGEIKLPQRGTSKAMAYDFFSPIDIDIYPGQMEMIFTDVKAYMQDNEALILNVRSSMGKRDIMMSNTQGWIDADYYSNPSNDGNIGICLKNNSNKIFRIHKGDRIAQGMFIPFLIADNGNVDTPRKGGLGSTGK